VVAIPLIKETSISLNNGGNEKCVGRLRKGNSSYLPMYEAKFVEREIKQHW
jgi:hypothetical protein